MDKILTIWSTRFTPAKGNHQVPERQCKESDSQAWLAIFRKDEPGVTFVASIRKPAMNGRR